MASPNADHGPVDAVGLVVGGIEVGALTNEQFALTATERRGDGRLVLLLNLAPETAELQWPTGDFVVLESSAEIQHGQLNAVPGFGWTVLAPGS